MCSFLRRVAGAAPLYVSFVISVVVYLFIYFGPPGPHSEVSLSDSAGLPIPGS